MGDFISRQTAIDALEESKARYFDRKVIIGKMQDIIKQLPSAQPESRREWYMKGYRDALSGTQPERKTGRWIETNPQNSEICRLITCSECGKGYIVNINVPYEDWTDAHKFCIECGAKMGMEMKI